MSKHIPRLAAGLAAIAIWTAIATAQTPPASGDAGPTLPVAGATVEALVPAGWEIEQRRQADFNGDRRADVLLLLRQAGVTDGTPRRVLMVALAAAQRGYTVAEANPRLIPRDPSGAIEDPMADGEIVVRPGGFDIKIGMLPGAGSYQAATMRYRFRFERGCFRLIGYDRNETHRATLDTRDVSVNFLTGAVIRRTGNEETKASKTTAETLRPNPRRCLAELGDGWTFDPSAAG